MDFEITTLLAHFAKRHAVLPDDAVFYCGATEENACRKNKYYNVYQWLCVCVCVPALKRKGNIRCGRVGICFISISVSLTPLHAPISIYHPLIHFCNFAVPSRAPAVIACCLIVQSEMSELLPLRAIKVPFERKAAQCYIFHECYLRESQILVPILFK